jgi:hypothetical protein
LTSIPVDFHFLFSSYILCSFYLYAFWPEI